MGGLTFKFRPSMDMQQTLEMISNDFLRLRAEAIQRKITYDAATLMQEEVQNRIPRTAQYAAYRSALKIVQSGFASAPVFAIMADPAEAQSETVEGETDVLTFKLRGSKRRRSLDASLRARSERRHDGEAEGVQARGRVRRESARGRPPKVALRTAIGRNPPRSAAVPHRQRGQSHARYDLSRPSAGIRSGRIKGCRALATRARCCKGTHLQTIPSGFGRRVLGRHAQLAGYAVAEVVETECAE